MSEFEIKTLWPIKPKHEKWENIRKMAMELKEGESFLLDVPNGHHPKFRSAIRKNVELILDIKVNTRRDGDKMRLWRNFDKSDTNVPPQH